MAPWEEYLKTIYFDPSHPASFAGPEKLYKIVKSEGKFDIGMYRIRKFLHNQEPYSLHKPVRRRFQRNHVISAGKDDLWMADLIDMVKFEEWNDGHKYILLVIDTFSKYVWLRSLKTKTGGAVAEAFKDIFKKTGRVPAKLMTDKGSSDHVILTVVPQATTSTSYTHIRIFNGTPYDASFVDPQNLIIRNINTVLYSCDVDVSRDLLYIFDSRIRSIEIVGIQPGVFTPTLQPFHEGISPSVYVKIAVDWISNNVYWVDPLHQWIAVQPGTNLNTDRTLYSVIVDDELGLPTALALDPLAGNKRSSVTIERSSLQGTQRRAIVYKGLGHPTGITVDRTTSEILWVDYLRDTIEKSDYDGNNRKMILRLSHTTFFDIAMYQNSIIVTDLGYDQVLFINKITGNVERFYSESNETYYGVSMFSNINQPNTFDNMCLSMSCTDICIGGGTNDPVCACRSGYVMQADGTTCIEDDGKYYRAFVVSDSTQICRITIQMASHSSFYRCTTGLTTGINGDEIKFMDVDSNSAEFIYTTTSAVYKVDVDGQKKRKLTDVSDDITGIAFDWINGNIYLTSGTISGKISLLSGGNIVTVLTVTYPRNVVVDPHHQKLFWIAGTRGNNIIERANLSGNERRTIVTSGQLGNPRSLELDLFYQELYWIDEGFIKKCTVDGMGLERVEVTTRVGFTNPDILLVYKDYLLWTEDLTQDSSQIHVVQKSIPTRNLNRIEFSALGKFNNFLVKDPSLQKQDNGSCQLLNGGCEQICIPNGQDRSCLCQYGFKLDTNGVTCSSKTLPIFDNFFLFSDWTHNDLYQGSLISGEIIGLKTGSIDSPTGVVFDHVHNIVIFGETGDDLVRSFDLHSSEMKIVSETGFEYGSYPSNFAMDYTSGNIYYTAVPIKEVGFAGVGILTLDGKHIKLIENGNKTRGIALDPEEGIMIWTDYEQAKVWKAFMDGSSQQEIVVSSDLTWPGGNAIDRLGISKTLLKSEDWYGVISLENSDPDTVHVITIFDKVVYIPDSYTDKIFRCNYMTLTACITVHHDPDAHPMRIFTSNEFLYYTSWNRQYITRLDKTTFTNKERIANNPELGRLDDIFVYNSSEHGQTVHGICSTNNGLGPCSTFCLPRGRDSFTCACEDGVSLSDDGYRCANINPPTTTPIQTSPTLVTSTSKITTQTTSISTVKTTLTSSTKPTTISSSIMPIDESSTTLTTSTANDVSGTEASSSSDNIVVIGASAAGGAVAIIIMILLIVLIFRRRSPNPSSGANSTEMDSRPLSVVSSEYAFIEETAADVHNSEAFGYEKLQNVNKNQPKEMYGHFNPEVRDAIDLVPGSRARANPYTNFGSNANVEPQMPTPYLGSANPTYEQGIASDSLRSAGQDYLTVIRNHDDNYITFGNQNNA